MKRFTPAVEELEGRLATSHVVTMTHYFTLTQGGVPAGPILFPPFPYTYLVPPPRSVPFVPNYFYEPGTAYWGPYNLTLRESVGVWTWQQTVNVPSYASFLLNTRASVTALQVLSGAGANGFGT
jgi:hypothetical protein